MTTYSIKAVTLPDEVSGVTVRDEHGFYNIYVNKHLSFEQQKKAADHELEHIRRDDFGVRLPIEIIEPYQSSDVDTDAIDKGFLDTLPIFCGVSPCERNSELLRFFITLSPPEKNFFRRKSYRRSRLDIHGE